MTEAVLKKVFSNIRTIREFRNYSQEYLALKLGISQNAYSKIELGYTNISLSRVMAIAVILEVSLADIVELDVATLEKIPAQKLALIVST
ncbi:helix-turn-helix domain-containing protein [Mucilaginibacter calamicampi]|uniref:Helix-turn-helix domain-containing protein n=1 Tax=Mucilaginibacter calamicampi TaxID=1302352 RepID=A0ABW2Z085_9SPHI